MAPGRRRGANKARGKNELSLGDLVLGKVKGFPAWPGKISRPEDWEHSPDPKKYFVEFFGTKEMFWISISMKLYNLLRVVNWVIYQGTRFRTSLKLSWCKMMRSEELC